MAETTTDITPQVEETEQSNSAEAESTEQVETESTDVAEEECIREEILDKEEMKKIFVGGIPLDCTDEELKEFFETISGGIVTDNVIIRKDSDKTKKSYFGFVTFDTCELVDEVLLKRDQLKIKDKQLDVNRAVPKDNQSPGAHEKTKKLFIANLPKTDCTEEQLMKYFNKRHPCKNYGVIESIQLIKKKGEDGKPTEENKGYGFITVSTEDFADKLAIQHSKFEFGGRKIDLKKSVNESKGSRGGRGGRGGGGGPMYANQGYGGFGGYGGYGGYGGWDGYGPGFGGGYDYYGGYGGGAGGFQQRRKGGGQGGRFTPY